MTAESRPTKIKKPRWRRWAKWALRTAIVLVVLAIAVYAATSYLAAQAIHNEIARIRAAGQPLTFDDLDALSPEVDRAQDAGPYYAAAAELVNPAFESNDADYALLFGKDPTKVTPAVMAWARRGLDQNHMALQLLDQGSALPGCNFDMQLRYGMAVALPRLGKIRRLSNAASLRAHVLAEEGSGDAAVESVISSLGMLRTMDRQPVVITVLTEVAVLCRACGDADFVLERGHLTDAALRKLYDGLLRVRLPQPRQIYLAERVYCLEVSRALIANGRPTAEDALERPRLPEGDLWSSLGVMGRVMVARGLPEFARFIDGPGSDWPEVLSVAQSAKTRPSALDNFGISGQSVLLQMVFYGRGVSILHATLDAIQVERFRLAHGGRLPDSLAELPGAGDLPKDPFTGNTLLYVKTSAGYCIFSAGRGQPEDDFRDKDPVRWSERWGIHVVVQPGEGK